MTIDTRPWHWRNRRVFTHDDELRQHLRERKRARGQFTQSPSNLKTCKDSEL